MSERWVKIDPKDPRFTGSAEPMRGWGRKRQKYHIDGKTFSQGSASRDDIPPKARKAVQNALAWAKWARSLR